MKLADGAIKPQDNLSVNTFFLNLHLTNYKDSITTPATDYHGQLTTHHWTTRVYSASNIPLIINSLDCSDSHELDNYYFCGF